MSTDKRTYPTYPIPAVGAIILNDDHVLLIQRGHAPAKGKWTLPGGVIELGESPEEALIREVEEECQLTITLNGVVGVVNRIVQDEQNVIKYHYIIIDYLAHCVTGTSMSPQPGSDVVDARWVPLQELTQYDVTEGLVNMIQTGITMQRQ